MRCSKPGYKLEKLMEKWEDQIMDHDQDQWQYEASPWKSLEEIEQIILNEERSYMILMKNKEIIFNSRIQSNKLKS